MLETLELSSLEQRRSINRLVFMFKVGEGLVPAIPPDDFLKPQKPKRQIKSKKYTDYISKNLVDRHSVRHVGRWNECKHAVSLFCCSRVVAHNLLRRYD